MPELARLLIPAGDESLHGPQSFIHDSWNAFKVAAQDFQRELLRIDFAAGADTKTPQHRNGGTPAMHRMQKEKRQHEARDDEPALVASRAEKHSTEGQPGSIRFQPALDVPLMVQFMDPA